MIRFIFIIFLCCVTSNSFSDEASKFVGIWAAGGIEKEGPAIFLFPNGKAYFHAMCGKAIGSWKTLESPEKIEIKLQEDEVGPVDTLTLHIDDRGWLVLEKTISTPSNLRKTMASELLREAEKTKQELPKIE
ncbi:MAG: hypothetical protein PXX77_03005 [Gallionella sp.]|nr:hypothetical protein [Gallionella sp.]